MAETVRVALADRRTASHRNLDQQSGVKACTTNRSREFEMCPLTLQ